MSTRRAKKHKELVETERWIKKEMRLDDRSNMDFVRSLVRFSRWLRRNKFLFVKRGYVNISAHSGYLSYLKYERPKIIPSLERLKGVEN